MTAELLDGKKVSEIILEGLAKKIAKMQKKPNLTAILVGEDTASEIYVGQKEKVANKIGINFNLIKKPGNTSQIELETLIDSLNKDPKVQGIIVQKPLPSKLESDKIDLLIDPKKDVDGLNPISEFTPATTRGIIELLNFYKIKIEAKRVVVIGISKLVGLPTALEFLNKNATVSICHIKTPKLVTETKQADILVVAAGHSNLISANMVKKGAVVIDVGINRIEKRGKIKLVGDVDFQAVSKIASFVTPVPGGVGPMTVAGLMQNLIETTS
ncbi:MAG: hypothetical protein A2172_05190 [Candidatus Woykebacteria bacterium RBG_13_40_15]|uniref:Bifunctional protein FolD n=1 Tax=Candidatus Woykebacteria bacterium RBG_13_40_15 TaxID=1802593 RepID=A0A1G1W897_9BACT|nr:MAG: hypothetical protein A2172_05190 [Candidatus Woykebacteria bacterium RBG_13_40_15]